MYLNNSDSFIKVYRQYYLFINVNITIVRSFEADLYTIWDTYGSGNLSICRTLRRIASITENNKYNIFQLIVYIFVNLFYICIYLHYM